MRLSGRWNRLGGGTGNSALGRSLRAPVAAALCILMAGQPFLADATVVKRGPTAGAPVAGDARILHALNRLTFGPRPGDVAAIKAMGLNTWFEMQLNPAQIDDSALDARLAMFPAMQLPQAMLISRFPSQQMIKQFVQSRQWLPNDPIEHAIYADQMAFYKIQQAKQAEKAATATSGDATASGAMASSSSPANSDPNAPPAARKARKGPATADMAGGDMASGASPAPPPGSPSRQPAPGGAMMSDGSTSGGTMSGDMASAPLPKSDLADSSQAPAQHVEALFKDLEAVNIINLAPEERMRKVIALSPEDFVSFRQSLSGAELAQFAEGLNPQQREIFAALQNSTRLIGSEELQARIIRDIYSDRQLEAVMTDFWLNHFNVYIRKNQNEPYLIPSFERDVIRPNALGKFENLLVATAKSPAMLMYLDNWQSIGPDSKAAKQGPDFAARARSPQVRAALKDRGLNENYGRELMELHTLGVNGGYTQADVTNVAKVFTGWTINQPARGGEFQFDERRHEPGSKALMGKTISENGENEGLEVLHMLAASPATAKFISTKLAIRFVSDDPPPALVDRMAQSFLSSGGDIKSVLRTMFSSAEFWAPATEKSKVKTPLEFVVSAVRASGAQVNNAQGLVQALDRLGMPLYGMQTPNGYSWLSDPWVSTGALVSRMNFALVMAGDKLPGIRTDWSRLLSTGNSAMAAKPVSMAKDNAASSDVDPEVAAKEARLELTLLGQPVSDRTRSTVIGQSNDSTAAIQAAKEFQGGGAGKFGGGASPLLGGEFNPVMPGQRPNAYATGANGSANGPNAQKNGIPDDRQAAVMAGLLLGSPEFQRR
jgi:uncharacterized protein (DUF1800 family)